MNWQPYVYHSISKCSSFCFLWFLMKTSKTMFQSLIFIAWFNTTPYFAKGIKLIVFTWASYSLLIWLHQNSFGHLKSGCNGKIWIINKWRKENIWSNFRYMFIRHLLWHIMNCIIAESWHFLHNVMVYANNEILFYSFIHIHIWLKSQEDNEGLTEMEVSCYQ